MSALCPAFFILYLESFMSRLNVIPRHDLTLSVGKPDNAAAQTGAGTSFGANGDQHTRAAELSTYFLRFNNSETFVELVGARPLHLLSQTVLPLKSPTGAFIAAQTLIFRRKQTIRTHLLSEISSDYFRLVRVARIELTAS